MMLKGNFKLGSCVAAVLSTVKAVAIIGKPEGFGSKASGGVAGPTVTPSNTVELTRYLVQEGPLNIVVEKTFDFRELQGIAWECGCAPYGIASMCQLAINKRGWCQTVQPAAPMVAMEYQKASLYPLVVSSDKSVLGVNKKGIIRGKGFLMADGTNNVILQNLEIKNLNARYKWVGDAITLDGTSNIWIDHIKTSSIGGHHIVTRTGTNAGVTISNNFIEGQTNWSPRCDTYHHRPISFTGANDTITFKNNYIHHAGDRSLTLGGNSVVHLVNNLWFDITGPAIESQSSYALLEGSVFSHVKATIGKSEGFIWAPTTDDKSCEAALGRSCIGNIYENSSTIPSNGGQPIEKVGKRAAKAVPPTRIRNLDETAGNTLLK